MTSPATTAQQEVDMHLSTTRFARAALVLLGALCVTAAAQAGTTGTEFQALHTLLTGWANGYLGKAMAIAAFLFGAGYGVAKQTIVPAILGIVFALIFAVGPGVIDSMLTATI